MVRHSRGMSFANFSDMDHESGVRAAVTRIAGFTAQTPSHALGTDDLIVKREDLQIGGSFKIRGVANKFLITDETIRTKGLVTVSTGNTGAALCHVGEKFSVPVHVFVLEDCERRKVDYLLELGATVHTSGRSFFEASVKAREFADERGMLSISSSADWEFVYGLGTIALEIIDEHPDLDVLFLPMGGGGLAAGVGTVYAALKGVKKPRIIGVQAEKSRPIYDCFHYGRITAQPGPTAATCLAGDLEEGAIIVDILRSVLSDVVLVSDAEIILATERLASFGVMVEPGAAVGYAAHLRSIGSGGGGVRLEGPEVDEKVGIILTGAAMERRAAG
jgi:threonine dehydratase